MEMLPFIADFYQGGKDQLEVAPPAALPYINLYEFLPQKVNLRDPDPFFILPCDIFLLYCN